MDIWLGGVVDPLVDEVFRGARTPIMQALREELGGRPFGTSVDLWSVTPLLVSETLPFEELCVYRARKKEYSVKQFLSPIEFLAASKVGRIRLLGGIVRRSVDLAASAGVKGLDAPAMLAAIDRATQIAIARVESKTS